MSAKGGFTIIDIEEIFKNGKQLIDDNDGLLYYKGVYDMFEKARGYGKPIYINSLEQALGNGYILPIITYVKPTANDNINGLGIPIKILLDGVIVDMIIIVTQEDKMYIDSI